MRSLRAAAEIDPVSLIASRSAIFPGPIALILPFTTRRWNCACAFAMRKYIASPRLQTPDRRCPVQALRDLYSRTAHGHRQSTEPRPAARRGDPRRGVPVLAQARL